MIIKMIGKIKSFFLLNLKIIQFSIDSYNNIFFYLILIKLKVEGLHN